MKKLLLSYLLGIVGIVSPVAGLHRFYLNKPISGVFYLLTWGFLGVGTVIDLIRMPVLVDECNGRLLLSQKRLLYRNSQYFSNPEREILKVCKRHNGTVTVQMVSLESTLSLNKAKDELERLRKEGFCSFDIDVEGNEIYRFSGLDAKEPLFDS